MSRDTPIRSSIARESLFSAELLLRKSGFGFVRLGLSCVVNRNRKVGANSPGAIAMITIQWWLYPLQELGRVRGALKYMLGNFPLWPDGEWEQERERPPSLTASEWDQESCYSWNNRDISYWLNSKCARRGNMAGPQQLKPVLCYWCVQRSYAFLIFFCSNTNIATCRRAYPQAKSLAAPGEVINVSNWKPV